MWSHLVAGSTWARLDTLRLTWSHLVSHECTWPHLTSLGLTCSRLVSHGLTRSRLASLGLACTHLGSLGITWTRLINFTWIRFDSLGSTWNQLVSLGFTRSGIGKTSCGQNGKGKAPAQAISFVLTPHTACTHARTRRTDFLRDGMPKGGSLPPTSDIYTCRHTAMRN